MRNFAPVLVHVYDRPEHFKNCIESLSKCPEAQYSELYISSDFYRNEKEKKNVLKVRKYIKSIKGFKKVIPILFNKNVGGDYAGHFCKTKVFEKYESVIIMEDDIEVSPLFLNYTNKGLDFYKNDPRIFSICGFSPFILGDNYFNKNLQFKAHEWNAWGFGMWKDKYINASNHRKSKDYFIDLNKDLRDKFFIKKLNQMSLEYYPHLLFSLKNKSLPEFDYFLGYYCLKNNFFNIHSTQSFTINKGNDGSGSRAKYNKEILSKMKLEALTNEIPEFKKLNDLKLEEKPPYYSANRLIIFFKIVLIKLKLFKEAKYIYNIFFKLKNKFK